MHDGSGRIAVQNLTKQFGAVTAVQNLSFTVEPGSVTGFLGPNGAGKTTTLRMLLGLVTPTSGAATINGRPYTQLGNPARIVGAVLENEGFHAKRTARNHLRVYAAAIGVPDQRVDELLGLVGLSPAADRPAGGYSLGMRQRLSLATALLGDPQVLVLDEPSNGLDPEGIAWLRGFLQSFAQQGRTVLVSSHLLSEVEQMIDQVVIVSAGMTRYYGPLEQLRASQRSRVLVQPADANALVTALREAGVGEVQPAHDGRVAVTNAGVQQIGDVAAKAGVAVYGMEEEKADLEQLFFQMTSPQYAGGAMPPGQPPQQPPQPPPGPPQQPPGPPPGFQQGPPAGQPQNPYQAPGYQQPGQQGWGGGQ
ncbi:MULTISPECIES: ABC transporter ATP-binding protein [Prauserella salsuginis group]|uniref:ABC-2 type transport system ATP-binding protein n=2 Tax=Prauserella salsuginis group TaxID=2893672 RepID=A0A839XSL2_9PSEU|nr:MULTISPECIES: ABC transporter ATP-binding protein [Prauserella salsuginis group]MBB3663948.1 ABC-2 type transport system ATP-binding protein [Prauserella sediminis]MCR3721404.1 ABC-2 type transport system ATP-binding protein [Prauserella flava]MCR3732394.1 ABC-2 type transport system ATP-binding protein [Prauserella salsuginis]